MLSARVLTAAAVAAAAALSMTACSSSDPLSGNKVVIGSANFPENVLLASIYSQALQAKGVKVTEKFDIGSREVLYGQLKDGKLTILPEYNGGLLSYLDPKSTAASSADVNAALAKDLPSSIELLNSAAAEDKDTLTVSQETAAKYNLKSIADLAPLGAQFTVGGQPEFKSRREQQFQDVYGVGFKEWKPTADTTANAIKDGTVQVGDVFTTDPRITSLGLVPLADPKNLFGAQNVTPVVYKSQANSTVTDTLNAVSAKLDTAGLLAMMKQVSVDKDDPSQVAKEWVKANGLA
ncbi:ABC transporter substrate-binding protein [Kitasatospora viridis]|uniref:Osmoprotectant transport system substrate-binding protein n=1 Tax=Kitasatospora viridis TaxID=281105 RepID=A0A561UBA0_9ACTN|nr:ABC transporter substrate-binding protein [Kitasatospora viridis]TWF96638.1 osmoprotectant transport system substrate-binding protein [Kitasatospora viridis]